MMSKSRISAPMRAIDLLMRLAVVFAISWFLYINYMAPKSSEPPVKLEKAVAQALQAKDTAQARTLFDHYLAASPADPIAYINICQICDKYKRADLILEYALRGTQQCVGAPPQERAQLYLWLAQAYDDGKARDFAQRTAAAAKQAVALAPEDPMVLNGAGYEIANTSTDINDLADAERMIDKALKLLDTGISLADRDTELAMFEDSYGWVLYKEGEYGSPADRASSYARAIDALVQATDDIPEQTSTDPEKVKDFNDTFKIVYYHLAVVYAKAGRPDDARNVLQVALHYDPQYQEALQEQQKLTNEAAAPALPSPASTAPGTTPAFTPLQAPSTTSTPTQTSMHY